MSEPSCLKPSETGTSLMREGLQTIAEAIRFATAEISKVSGDQPRRQAEWLLENILSCNRAEVYSSPHRILSADEHNELNGFLRRRAQGEPLQYIFGAVEFRHLTLRIDRRALIPRPETEGLAEIALKLIRSISEPVILDVGTGCGAIALSIVQEQPNAYVIGVDKDEEALSLARENGEILDLSNRVSWEQMDVSTSQFKQHFNARKFDLIISNPPYVSETEYYQLPTEIRDYEPPQALLAGKDGLDFIRVLAGVCGDLLRDQQYLVCEIGELQSEASQRIFEQAGWDVRVSDDLSGKPRYLTASPRRRT